jgi:hypothetical protein
LETVIFSEFALAWSFAAVSGDHQKMTKSQQIQSFIDQGSMLQLRAHGGMLVCVGYAELWMARHMLFYCAASDLSTDHQHVLRLKKIEIRPNRVAFYDALGDVVATLARFAEWPESSIAREARQDWPEWQKELDEWARDACRRQANEWRDSRV